MLTSSRTMSARIAQRLMPWVSPTPRRFPNMRPPSFAAAARAHHAATGKFTKEGPDGTPVTEEVSMYIGDPGSAYVTIPTEVGDALRAGAMKASALKAAGSSLADGSSTPSKHPDRHPLLFFHDTQHFASESSPSCPRLYIPQQLPRQSPGDTSPATLYCFGVMHNIALDGTSDAGFIRLVETVLPDIRQTLERLKDM